MASEQTDLNIRIAKLRGWMEISGHYGKDPNFGYVELPNWSGSLDLMHELIAVFFLGMVIGGFVASEGCP